MAFVSIDLNPPPRTLRNFGFIGLVAFGALAALANQHMLVFAKLPPGATPTTVYVLAGLAAYCGLFAVAAPAALKWLYLALTVISYPIGFVLSYVIVTLMFFAAITPLAFIFKIMGRDALKLRREENSSSYWIRRTPPATVTRYFRQF